MKKKLTAALLAAGMLALCACSSGGGAPAQGTDAAPAQGAQETAQGESAGTITVGVNPVPHEIILSEVVKDVLAKDGYELEIVVFTDYVLPNQTLNEGELDANYFQTLGYMDQQNADVGYHLKAVCGVHIEPMGIYSEKHASLEELPDGASIGIPNDPDNGERALDLLVQKGLLVSKGGYGTDAAVTFESLTGDAQANPRGFVITPLEAANLPNALPDLDCAAINGNYALGAGLPDKYPALDIEEFDDEAAIKRTNFIVCNEGDESSEKIQALVKAVQSEEVRAFIEETYKGAVIPSFIDAP
ncbi:MAG: MetQ/NlpA family ABC transporter substrate-binding protein [Lachnospiraceae bacterium]|nr:MetQ/NlpA family ABC transporter substrate-binding protein [Lachnospiraceae bacterium]